MSEASCLVSAKDYRQHFKGGKAPSVTTPVWTGLERRVTVDRRADGHERRWEQTRGRRFRLSDRRRVMA